MGAFLYDYCVFVFRCLENACLDDRCVGAQFAKATYCTAAA
jgi:hypothetical protein